MAVERFVIVGASLAGGTAAATLRHEGFDGDIVLIGAEPHLPYERPPLSKRFLRGEVPFEDALVQPGSFWRNNDIHTRLGTIVVAVDPASGTVVLGDGERMRYDRLLIATGARNRRFPIPGLGELLAIHDLRTVDDARAIQAEIQAGRRAVVCGMGFIGSEVAASLRQRGVDVTAVDGGAVPLERVLGEQVGAVLGRIHRENGVRIVSRDRVAAFEGPRGGRVERVVTANGQILECDFAVTGLGVEPVTDLVEGSGVEVDNGIVVDELCRTNVPGIFAAGDVANHHHPVFGGQIRVEHWQNAMKQGRVAALNMLDRRVPYDDVHWFWSDQFDHDLQYGGYHRDWDDLVVRGSLDAESFSAFYRKEGRVRAVVSMDRGHDVIRSMPLIKAGGEADPAKLADEDVDLRSLA